MDIATSLVDLQEMHPQLLWDEIVQATIAVFQNAGLHPPFSLRVRTHNIPSFGNGSIGMLIDPSGIPLRNVARVERTYEPSRLVEHAAIAIAGLALYHAGGHEIRDIALRGDGADYQVDECRYLLEVAGRSRRSDFRAAWRQKRRALRRCKNRGVFLCVAEFETPAARLTFKE